jgi:hypothetical protein
MPAGNNWQDNANKNKQAIIDRRTRAHQRHGLEESRTPFLS